MEPDWPRMTLVEADTVLRRYPQAGGALELLSFSPRPFSAASLVATPRGKVFVKRHSRLVRDHEGLLEEHRLIGYLAARTNLVPPVLACADGDTVVSLGEWTYEVHAPANGLDVYEEALSWTPFACVGHARAAGQALAELHRVTKGYTVAARKLEPLVSSFSIFSSAASGPGPMAEMAAYLEARPSLRSYLEKRDWRTSMDELLMPFYRELRPWLGYLEPLWTHNDFHASNLTWSNAGEAAEVAGIIDFGLADRTNAVHDLATAIERNIVEWLRIADPQTHVLHLDHLDALLQGYEHVHPLSREEAHALVAMLPLVHCEFALSEADYFLSILHSEEKAYLAYEGYFLQHARWFQSTQGRQLRMHLKVWAESKDREPSPAGEAAGNSSRAGNR